MILFKRKVLKMGLIVRKTKVCLLDSNQFIHLCEKKKEGFCTVRYEHLKSEQFYLNSFYKMFWGILIIFSYIESNFVI